jgi:hypothetical protein
MQVVIVKTEKMFDVMIMVFDEEYVFSEELAPERVIYLFD